MPDRRLLHPDPLRAMRGGRPLDRLDPEDSPIRVDYSILAAEAVLQRVVEAYSVVPSARCELLWAGMNDTYLVTTPCDDRYITRVYRAGWRSEGEIRYELEFISHLARKGIPVCGALPAANGSVLQPLRAPEGTRHMALFEHVQGAPLSWTDVGLSALAGHLLARVHTAGDDFRTGHPRIPLDLDYLIDAPLAALRPFFFARPEDWAYLEGFATRLRASVERAGRVGLDWGPCHGDFSSTGNFRVSPDGMVTVLDFDLCGPGWRAYDMAPIQREATGHKMPAIWDSFLEAYSDTRHLREADRASLPIFLAVSRLWTMGARAAQADRWGAVRVEGYIDSHLAFCKKWEEESGCLVA